MAEQHVPAGGDPPATRAEKWAGVLGAVFGAVLVVICVDLVTGGKITGALAGARQPCEGGCGDDG